MASTLSPELLIAAYAQGAFPMASSRSAKEIRWYSPDPRAILPLENFHLPRRLARLARQAPFEIRRDTAFDAVIAACAETPRKHEKGSWINAEIRQAYGALHRLGHAHSVECWENELLVGGLYGVQLGGAFFGESMFSLRPNASKLALVHLIEHLQTQGFTLLDVQFTNPHLLQFGVQEISHAIYLKQLLQAIHLPVHF